MKKPLLAAALLLTSVPTAVASSQRLKVMPSTIKAGKSVRLYGSLGTGCPKGDQVTITSKAFTGATKHEFAGVPALLTSVGASGSFSTTVTIRTTTRRGPYTVSGRCGGGLFGSASLKVS
jgi:hypothetical protein